MHATFLTPFHPPWFDHPNNLLGAQKGVCKSSLLFSTNFQTPWYFLLLPCKWPWISAGKKWTLAAPKYAHRDLYSSNGRYSTLIYILGRNYHPTGRNTTLLRTRGQGGSFFPTVVCRERKLRKFRRCVKALKMSAYVLAKLQKKRTTDTLNEK